MEGSGALAYISLWQRNVIVACVLLVAILHIIRQSTNLIGHAKIMACRPFRGGGLACETSCVAPYSMLLTSAQMPHICGCSHLDKSKVPPLAETSYIYIDMIGQLAMNINNTR